MLPALWFFPVILGPHGGFDVDEPHSTIMAGANFRFNIAHGQKKEYLVNSDRASYCAINPSDEAQIRRVEITRIEL